MQTKTSGSKVIEVKVRCENGGIFWFCVFRWFLFVVTTKNSGGDGNPFPDGEQQNKEDAAIPGSCDVFSTFNIAFCRENSQATRYSNKKLQLGQSYLGSGL